MKKIAGDDYAVFLSNAGMVHATVPDKLAKKYGYDEGLVLFDLEQLMQIQKGNKFNIAPNGSSLTPR